MKRSAIRDLGVSPKFTTHITTAPLSADDAASRVRMNRRPALGERIGDQAVLHRIMVDVGDVAGEVVVVADQVFPEAPLPEIVFATPVADERHAATYQRAREAGLDRPPAPGEVGIVGR